METTIRGRELLLKQLAEKPWQYDFFQAVTLINRILQNNEHLSVHFRSSPQLTFAKSDILEKRETKR